MLRTPAHQDHQVTSIYPKVGDGGLRTYEHVTGVSCKNQMSCQTVHLLCDVVLTYHAAH